MVRAVFFDWVNTLVRMEPDRHVLSAEVCREFGIPLNERDALRGIYAADEEAVRSGAQNRMAQGDAEANLRYNNRVLAEAGIPAPDRNTAVALLRRLAERFRDYRFVPFDDVRPSLLLLRRQGIVTGLVSNMPRPMQPIIEAAGLGDLLDFAVTPLDANGAGKPAAQIFVEALKRAGARPAETLHVGDEPFTDGKGAEAAGITPVIIDRHDVWTGVKEYRRITSLAELPGVVAALQADGGAAGTSAG